jgi:hypothetical protein
MAAPCKYLLSAFALESAWLALWTEKKAKIRWFALAYSYIDLSVWVPARDYAFTPVNRSG